MKGARRTWIAGGDLKELGGACDRRRGARVYAATMSDFLEGLQELPCPVVIAVDDCGDRRWRGSAALAGDVRLMTQSLGAGVQAAEGRVGDGVRHGAAVGLFGRVGARSGIVVWVRDGLGAEEARALGLVHEVVDDAAALDAAVLRVV